MKKRTFKTILFAVLASILSLAACSPEQAENEIKKKLHEDPMRAVFTLQEGTLSGDDAFSNEPKVAQFKPSETKPQIIEWKTEVGKPWHIASETKQFDVKNAKDNPNIVYRLTIQYYNDKNELMNDQFYQNGQDKIHQHFFCYYNKKIISGGKEIRIREDNKNHLPYDYQYADELNGKYVAKNNPMGFDGFIKFTQPGKQFNLSIELLHAPISKYDANGATSPFYLPSKILGSTGLWDVTVQLPVVVDGTPIEEELPQDESLFKPDRVVIHIYDGHLHIPNNFHQNTHAKENLYMGKNYELIYHMVKGKWTADKQNPQWVATLSTPDPYQGSVLAFDIHYYKGTEEITGQITEKGEDEHYQHFFIANNIMPGYAGKTEPTDKNGEEFFGYYYRDTQPWNKTNHYDKAPYADEAHQTGLKGFFYFKHARKKFNLDIKLMRAHKTKLTNGKPSPFYAPTPEQEQNEAWMPTIRVPMYVYMSTDDKALDDDMEEIKDENEYSERDKEIVHTLMDAFGLNNFKEGVAEFVWNFIGTPGHNNGGFWF